jgi:hypothetical protein
MSVSIYFNSFPNAVSGPEDRYVDASFDFQYERPFGPNLLDVHGTYIHEESDLGATSSAGGASTKTNHLNAFKLDGTYHWRKRYSATGALFSTTGNGDALLYAPAALTGSNNGRPDTSGYLAPLAFGMYRISISMSIIPGTSNSMAQGGTTTVRCGTPPTTIPSTWLCG